MNFLRPLMSSTLKECIIMRIEFRELFCSIVKSSDVEDDLSKLQMGNPPDWDSIANLNLLLAIETSFKVRFTMEDMAELDSIRKIVNRLQALGVSVD